MNILSGIGLAAAGIGALRKAFGNTDEKKGSGYVIRPLPRSDVTGSAVEVLTEGNVPQGSALQSEFSFSRGYLQAKRDPSVVVIRSRDDLFENYLRSGIPPRLNPKIAEENVPWTNLNADQRIALANMRANEDWANLAPILERSGTRYKPTNDTIFLTLTENVDRRRGSENSMIAVLSRQLKIDPKKAAALLRSGWVVANNRRLTTGAFPKAGTELTIYPTGPRVSAEPDVYFWDAAEGISKGTTSVSRANMSLVFDRREQRWVYKRPSDFTANERRYRAKSAELGKAAAQYERLKERYQGLTGYDFVPEACANVRAVAESEEIKKTCDAISKAYASFAKAKAEVDVLEQELEIDHIASINSAQIMSARQKAAEMRARGEDGILVVRPGYIRVAGKLKSSTAMTAEEAADAAAEQRRIVQLLRANPEWYRNEQFRRQFDPRDPNYISPEARKAFWEAYGLEESEQAFYRRSRGARDPETARQELMRTVPKGPLEPRTEYRPTGSFKKPPKRLRGLGDASGMMAPDVALVDGLGMSVSNATLGIGSVLLIGVGAFTLYKMMQPSPSSK